MKEKIEQGSDEQLNDAISRGALKLTDVQIATVSFVFWLVYMAEIDLHHVMSSAWKESGSMFSDDINKVAKEMLQKYVPNGKKIDPDNLEYFSDKITLAEALVGKNDWVELLYKLKTLRNYISHNRIDDLKYNDEPLTDRKTKEKILFDYFETSIQLDFSKSEIWNSLSEEDKAEIKEKFNQLSTNKTPGSTTNETSKTSS